MKYLALLSVVALAACNDVTAPKSPVAPARSGSQIVENDKTDFSSPGGIIACNGESVTLNGTIHTLIKETINANGSTSFFSINETLSGIGDVTGAKYEGSQTERYVSNTVGAQVFDMSISVRLVAQGKVPNMFIDSDLHVTQNANGDITVEREHDSVRCDN